MRYVLARKKKGEGSLLFNIRMREKSGASEEPRNALTHNTQQERGRVSLGNNVGIQQRMRGGPRLS
jgi:hypothetical protein